MVDKASITIEPEETAYMGPMWLNPWPYPALTVDESGQWHLHAKSLYVPFSWWIPMPDRFKGQYYCHLIYPPYLEALLRGQLRPDFDG